MKPICNCDIRVDFRERRSGIPEMIRKRGVRVIIDNLKTGDYLINDEILVERKTREDFIGSLVQNRLFGQCARLRQSAYAPLLIIEGNPYVTGHKISAEAIRGALVSVSVAWQIPVLIADGPSETCDIMLLAGRQMVYPGNPLHRKGRKGRMKEDQRSSFLQGLPGIGARLAVALLKRFGSVQAVVNSSPGQMMEVDGIGKKKAAGIRSFLEKTDGP
ncbi:MAG: hypothetical protein JW861_10700 [Bacteroidales bacterium]|nr:hypothetical protein [Bacteroidales bacterium]